MTLPIALVVHGHFYQPPRENPWTDQLEREPSAAPHHDWNARIHDECYRANAFARIHDGEGRIESIVNNYARLSFNFGPTLARWLERHDGRTHTRLRAADAEQRRRLGQGGAIAQAYAHPIVPLLSPNDRHTQLLWGLQDFRRRFGRKAAGLWLPETAVCPATLEALIELGVRFTILAPEQIAAVRAPRKDWVKVNRDTVETGRAYRWLHRDGSGRSIAIGVFDGPLSRAMAFGDAAKRADTFLEGVRASADRSTVPGQRLVLCASDGELFGHHKKFADLTLAFAHYVQAERQGIEVTNLAAFLEAHPPTWELRLAEGPRQEGTAWSCAHGLGRWRRNCGCSMGGPEVGWNQKWRGPLRDALDILRDGAADFYEDAAGELLTDPWGARNVYGEVVDSPLGARDRVLAEFGRPALARRGEGARQRVRLLLELQRATLLMYASCGWFFDDIAGLESSLVIRLAAHAVDLFRLAGGAPPVRDVLAVLAGARSNRKEAGTGADIFRAMAGQRITGRHAIAHAALAELIGSPAAPTAGFRVEVVERSAAPSPVGPALSGRARAIDQRTGVVEDLEFLALRRRGAAFECRVGSQKITLADLRAEDRDALLLAALPRLVDEPIDLDVIRLALSAGRGVAPEGSGLDPATCRRMFGEMLVALLSRPGGELTAEALSVAADLHDAADLPAGSLERRVVEELVWQHLEEGATSPGMVRLAERLGFSPEAVPAEVIAS